MTKPAKLILSVVGARPQFVKAAAVSKVLRKQHRELLVHTGQHYDANMSDVFFVELGIPEPDFHLGVGSGSHGEQTGAMLSGIERVIRETRPDMLLVYGDTNSTLAAALAAAKLHVPIAHVEAGLRSFDKKMPEEINRILTDHVSTWLFCPSDVAIGNLAAEGISRGVFDVGDVMCDVVRQVSSKGNTEVLDRLDLRRDEYVLVTIHRAENTDTPARLRAIMTALGTHEGTVVFPVHPRTRSALLSLTDWSPAPNIVMLEPLGYIDMIAMQQHARVIVTDSGGVQKEAYWLSVPCLTLRDQTEWTETVDVGWNRLLRADVEEISAAIAAVSRPSAHPPLYGDGQASRKISDILLEDQPQ